MTDKTPEEILPYFGSTVIRNNTGIVAIDFSGYGAVLSVGESDIQMDSLELSRLISALETARMAMAVTA